MFGKLTLEKLPLHYEVIFDRERLSILFSLCSEANSFFLEKMQEKNRIIKHLEDSLKLRPFVLPLKNEWGFGGIFKKIDYKQIEDGWVTWECVLPWRANGRALNGVSASINQMTMLMDIFHYDNKKAGSQTKKQLMTIDGMVIEHHDYLNQGNFSFSFSRPVLEFCERIWEDGNNYRDDIINTMMAVWTRLAGRKKIKQYERGDFRINFCQDDGRLLHLACPGNCA